VSGQPHTEAPVLMHAAGAVVVLNDERVLLREGNEN
jgi:hypothetical protein